MKKKLINFLNPEKNSHIIVPEYLKQYYLDSGYHLLPKNFFFQKILIKINILFLRKLKITFNFFWNNCFVYKNPPKSEIVVYDDENFNELKNIFPKQNYFILTTRISHIKKIYISKNIILKMLKNIFKMSLKQNYLCSLIELICPRKVVTFIDNSTDFFLTSKFLQEKKIEFIAIQNAHRYNFHSLDRNIFIPNYYVFGDYEVETFKKCKNVSRIKTIGNLRAAVAKNYFKTHNINLSENFYDICLISEPRLKVNFDYKEIHKDYDVKECMGLIADHTMRFCDVHKKKLIFSGKGDVKNKEFQQLEKAFYQNELNKYNHSIEFNDKSEFGQFKTILNSKLVIGMGSTLLRDSFLFKTKALVCSFIDHVDARAPSEGICTLKSKKYVDFEDRVLEILKLDYNNYLLKIENVQSFYNTKINTLEYLRNEMNL